MVIDVIIDWDHFVFFFDDFSVTVRNIQASFLHCVKKKFRIFTIEFFTNHSPPSFEPDVVCFVSVIPILHKSCSVLLFLSGWASTTGRLLGPKMRNNIKCKEIFSLKTFTKNIKYLSQGYHNALPHRESKQDFTTFWLLFRCCTNWAMPPPFRIGFL